MALLSLWVWGPQETQQVAGVCREQTGSLQHARRCGHLTLVTLPLSQLPTHAFHFPDSLTEDAVHG